MRVLATLMMAAAMAGCSGMGCRSFNAAPLLEKVPTAFYEISASAVHIICLDATGAKVSGGSGVVLPGYDIATAFHVIEDKSIAKILLMEDGQDLDQATLGYVKFQGSADMDNDWAVIRPIRRIGISCKVGSSRQMGRFEQVLVAGFPMGIMTVQVSEGRYQGIGEAGLLRISAPIVYGNSGGGVFTLADGEPVLIGLAVRMHSVLGAPIYHMGLVLPIEVIKNL